MQVVLLKITALRTKNGLKTVKREVIGYSPEDAEQRLDSLAGVLADLVMAQINHTKKEVAASG